MKSYVESDPKTFGGTAMSNFTQSVSYRDLPSLSSTTVKETYKKIISVCEHVLFTFVVTKERERVCVSLDWLSGHRGWTSGTTSAEDKPVPTLTPRTLGKAVTVEVSTTAPVTLKRPPAPPTPFPTTGEEKEK